jgi:uncharacterized membrane protein
MESRTKFLGHALHAMMVTVPIGLFVGSLVFDITAALAGNPEFYRLAYYLLLMGIVTGLLAAAAGLRDYQAIPRGTRARKIGFRHAIGNVVMLAAFGLSAFIRYGSGISTPEISAVVLSFLAMGLGGVTAWLGGELVERLGVGVDPGAHVNAPSSLSNRPATESDETVKTVPTTRGRGALQP